MRRAQDFLEEDFVRLPMSMLEADERSFCVLALVLLEDLPLVPRNVDTKSAKVDLFALPVRY